MREHVGYSLLDGANQEIEFWGETLGQCVAMPSQITLLSGTTIHAPKLQKYGSYNLVERWIEYDPSKNNLLSGISKDFQDNKLIVTYQYRQPNLDELKAYSANARYNKETGSIYVGPHQIYTDRGSQAMIIGIVTLFSVDPTATINYKTANGFINANATTMIALAQQVATHVQVCFSKESSVSNDIDNNVITTFEQIDAVYNAISIYYFLPGSNP